MADMMDRGFIVDTPAGIEMFRLLALKHALALEIRTGLRHSTANVLRSANVVMVRNGWIDKPFRRKGSALEALDGYIDSRQWSMLDGEFEVANRLLGLVMERRGGGGPVDWGVLSCLERHGVVWATGIVMDGGTVPEIVCGEWYEEHAG